MLIYILHHQLLISILRIGINTLTGTSTTSSVWSNVNAGLNSLQLLPLIVRTMYMLYKVLIVL